MLVSRRKAREVIEVKACGLFEIGILAGFGTGVAIVQTVQGRGDKVVAAGFAPGPRRFQPVAQGHEFGHLLNNTALLG